MDYPDDIRSAENVLKQAEKEFLGGHDGIAEVLLEKLSAGPFSSDIDLARKRMQNLDEARYVKWSRWEKKYEFSASFWKDEGYSSIDTTTLRASNPDWYSKRTDTAAFVKDIMTHRDVVAPTVNGERNGSPTPLGNPSNKWLLDFVALSSLRLSLKNHWEQLVHDIVMKRAQTSLKLVAERLGLTISEVLDIAQKIRNLDDHVIEHDVSDNTQDLTYRCRRPDPSLVPKVDITM
ncbi:hypothetical protein EU527_15990 [Candidatus Thorarchaeota archaeon]|nr:MAG: hypothetical protein EU527_15990 [Candidatus Thorarchaeota archaeon]